MIAATVGMAVMALLFVVFGVFALGDRGGCDGHCAGCGTGSRTGSGGACPAAALDVELNGGPRE